MDAVLDHPPPSSPGMDAAMKESWVVAHDEADKDPPSDPSTLSPLNHEDTPR